MRKGQSSNLGWKSYCRKNKGPIDPISQFRGCLIGICLNRFLTYVQEFGNMEKDNIKQGPAQESVSQDAMQMRSAAPPTLQLLKGDESPGEGSLGGSPLQLKNTIVDNLGDPRNDASQGGTPGSGKGFLQHSNGTVNDTVEFGALHNDCGTAMHGQIITSDYLGGIDTEGTAPKSGSWPNWWAAHAPAPNNYWVRGHLLNHNVGGPGEKRNLTPITKRCNSEHHNVIEKVIKLANENGGGIINYDVMPVYDGVGPQNLLGDATDPDSSCWAMLATGLQCLYTIQDDQGTTVQKGGAVIENKR